MNTLPPDAGWVSPQSRAALDDLLAETGPLPDPTTLPPAQGRLQADTVNARWNRDLPPMERVQEVWIEADAALGSARCRLRVLMPAGAGPGAILYSHGGGFAFGTPETHERCARLLALAAGMSVVLPDYRLAPEHPFPAGLRDVVASLRALRAGRLPVSGGGPVIVAGDSAGANLSLSAILHEQAVGEKLPDGALLFYGNFGADFTTDSYQRFAEGPGLTTARMQRYLAWYAKGRDLSHEPLACPLAASDGALSALPPLSLVAAGADPLLSDTLALHARLTVLGRSDPLTVVPGVVHGFLQQTLVLEAARETLRNAGAAARSFVCLA